MPATTRASALVALAATATLSLGVHALLARAPAARPRPAAVAAVAGITAHEPLSAQRAAPRARGAAVVRRTAPAGRAVPAAVPPPAPRRAVPSPRRPPVVVVASRPAPPPTPPAPAGPTTWGELNRAIARIPTYDPAVATWVVFAHDGYWGTADWRAATIYIGPQVPHHRLYDVAVHEWSHLLSLRAYDGDADAAMAGMNAYFGGTGMTGAERAADCMAVLQGASWTNYTSCRDTRWRAGAARLLRGEKP